jgi:aldehyde dehydrogenase (NAD+)/betaine-aldehyde dehydrogenase
MPDTFCFIDGEHVAADATYDNVDPSTELSLGATARGGEREVDAAVAGARRATAAWSRTAPEQRADLLDAYAGLIAAHRDELALLESEDTGKPLTQARNDATVCGRYFRFYSRAIGSYYGLSIPLRPDLHVYTRREPYGVTGHVLAWNYPLQLFGRAVAPSIATGNCAVVKPADETPRTTVRLAELAIEAGLPAGVVNVVTGIGAEAGSALVRHADVDHVGFVGSVETAAIVAGLAAQRVVPSVLELGGKSAHVLFPDADLDAAAPAIVKAIMVNAGQTCSAGSRVLVHEDIHDQLIDMLAASFSKVTVGRGVDDRDLGPLVSRKQQARVSGYVAGLTQGEIVYGGFIPDVQPDGRGAYYAPTLIDGVDHTSQIAQEEVFGPVLVAMAFSDEQEAVALANSTSYGLLGAVWTADLARAHRMAAEIRAGQVFVNNYGAGGGVELPFGGFKKSGYGREKGVEALDAYTQTKAVIVQL